MRILRARKDVHSFFSASSVENPSLGFTHSFARRSRAGRKPTARAGGGEEEEGSYRSHRIARVLGPVRTFLSRRVVPRARQPSIERTFQRSFVPARLSMGESAKGRVYSFRTPYTMRWGLSVFFMCDFQTIEIRNP